MYFCMFFRLEKKVYTLLSYVPLGRFGEIDEVVQPVLFLLSDAAGMITGERILIDGGFVTTN